jgi:hypothetical protein
MNAICVASGAGIKSGGSMENVQNIDIAPTVARLLGVSLQQTSGHVLDEILDDKD